MVGFKLFKLFNRFAPSKTFQKDSDRNFIVLGVGICTGCSRQQSDWPVGASGNADWRISQAEAGRNLDVV